MNNSRWLMIIVGFFLYNSCSTFSVDLNQPSGSSTDKPLTNIGIKKNPTLVKAVLTSGLNEDASPIDERTVFSPYEKVYLSVFIKDAEENKTVIQFSIIAPGTGIIKKYLVAKKNGDQYIGIDTSITDPFELAGLNDGKTYFRTRLNELVRFSFITPSSGKLLIKEIPIVVSSDYK